MSERPSPISNDVTALRAMIGKRKRGDRLFSFTGAAFIVLSLSVLGALMVKLVFDGTHRLLETHDVRADGQTPGYRDAVGILSAAGPAGTLPAGFEVQGDAIDLRGDSDDMDLAPLVGRLVGLKGDRPHPGNLLMSVVSAEPIEPLPPGETRPGDPDIVGKIIKAPRGHRTAFQLVPEPLRILSGPEVKNLESLAGQRVAAAGRWGGATGTIKASRVELLRNETFFTSGTSKNASEAGIWPGLIGTLLVTTITMLMAVPLGVAAGIYLEEYAPKNRVTAVIEINIANLAGVPSIIWGLLGLGLFIYGLGLGRTSITAGLTLGLLVLPIVIIATREAIRAVPNAIREAAIGLGATQWQTVRYHVIPYSMSGILTGSIIALSRAIGETAPLVCVGAVIFMTGTPGLNSAFTVMPMQIFDWVSRPQREFHANAAAASLILVMVTLALNGSAIYIRYHLRKKIKW